MTHGILYVQENNLIRLFNKKTMLWWHTLVRKMKAGIIAISSITQWRHIFIKTYTWNICKHICVCVQIFFCSQMYSNFKYQQNNIHCNQINKCFHITPTHSLLSALTNLVVNYFWMRVCDNTGSRTKWIWMYFGNQQGNWKQQIGNVKHVMHVISGY